MQILNYQEQAGGNVLATFDARSEKMRCTFRHLRLYRSKKGNLFIGFPSHKDTTSPSDKPKYTPHYEFDGDTQKQFQDEILAAVNPYLNGR